MQGVDLGLGHEGADLDVLRRQQGDDRPARRHPFTLAVHRVEYQAGLRGGLGLLGEVPFGGRQRGLQRSDVGFRGGDLVAAGPKLRRLEIRFELSRLLARLVAHGAGAVEVLRRGRSGPG